MPISKRVEKFMTTKGKGIVDLDHVKDISTKIKKMEDEGLIKRQTYTLPQMDTIGIKRTKNKTQEKEEV
jgi:hypothetical protein